MCFFLFGALHSSMRHPSSSGLRGGQDGHRCPIEGGQGLGKPDGYRRRCTKLSYSCFCCKLAGLVFSWQFLRPCGETVSGIWGRLSLPSISIVGDPFSRLVDCFSKVSRAKRFPGPTAGSPLGRVGGSHAGLLCFHLPLQGLLPLSISAPFITPGGVSQRRPESSFIKTSQYDDSLAT